MTKTIIIWTLKFAVSAGGVWWLASQIDFSRTLELGRAIAWWGIPLSIAVILFQVWLGAWRWRLVAWACQSDIGLGRAFNLHMVGLFFALILPGMVGGDVVKTVSANRGGMALGSAIRSIFLDRVLSLIGLVLLVAIVVPIKSDLFVGPEMWGVAGLVAATALATVLLCFVDRLPVGWLSTRLGGGVEALAANARALFFAPRAAARSLGLTLVSQFFITISVYVLAVAMGLPLGFWESLVLVPPAILAMTLPISIAGWGVREGALVWTLARVGIDPEAALALSLIFGVTFTLVGLIGGGIWLGLRDR